MNLKFQQILYDLDWKSPPKSYFYHLLFEGQ